MATNKYASQFTLLFLLLRLTTSDFSLRPEVHHMDNVGGTSLAILENSLGFQSEPSPTMLHICETMNLARSTVKACPIIEIQVIASSEKILDAPWSRKVQTRWTIGICILEDLCIIVRKVNTSTESNVRVTLAQYCVHSWTVSGKAFRLCLSWLFSHPDSRTFLQNNDSISNSMAITVHYME